MVSLLLHCFPECRKIYKENEARNKPNNDKLLDNLVNHSILYVNASPTQREQATNILLGEETINFNGWSTVLENT